MAKSLNPRMTAKSYLDNALKKPPIINFNKYGYARTIYMLLFLCPEGSDSKHLEKCLKFNSGDANYASRDIFNNLFRKVLTHMVMCG